MSSWFSAEIICLRGRRRILHRKPGDSLHHHRHTGGIPDLQDRPSVPMAVRRRSQRMQQPRRLHHPAAQHHMDNIRRPVGLPHAHFLRAAALHHHYRHPVRQTAFQDGRSVAGPVRQRRQAQSLGLCQRLRIHKKIEEADGENAVVITPWSYIISDHYDFLE